MTGVRPPAGEVRQRPSPALVISILALFVALSGSALALSRGEVKGKHIAANAVRAKHIKDGQIRSGEVLDGALTGVDIDEATLAGVAPSGAAGGDLTGAYPNPSINVAAVDSPKVANGSLTGDDVMNASLLGADLAADSVGTSEIQTDGVAASEVANNAIDGGEVVDFGLTARDVGVFEGTYNFNAGAIAANSCQVTSVDTASPRVTGDDHVIVTPPQAISDLDITVNAARDDTPGEIRLVFCNPTIGAIDPPLAGYALLVFGG